MISAACASFDADCTSPSAAMTLARRSRSASAWRAIARCIPDGISTSFTSTIETLIPQGAVAYFRIVAPKDAIVQVENFMVATSQIAQTTLRSVLGQHQLDELLSEREKINAILQAIIDEQTAPWGIKVSIVEVKDVEIPQSMQRAMARQAEAERERRAKVINAEGEYQASERLKDAAVVIEAHPIALQLRYLQTLLELGSSQSTTIAFPVPIEMLKAFSASAERRDAA